MILENIRKIFKKTDKKKEEERIEELRRVPLEKGDLPAMVLSAYIVILPIALLVLLFFAFVAYLFVR